jgi:hypothetical protein
MTSVPLEAEPVQRSKAPRGDASVSGGIASIRSTPDPCSALDHLELRTVNRRPRGGNRHALELVEAEKRVALVY